uniref:Putative ribonuclease H-like domain-containing protein n=1 Tax=Tanacetum cinerariifolium TaxID=118510 RepID=A0A6L2P2J2_TANCI|nr:putative ribonuclease H-like domain-containing protein [Tanacetum cinerariifolium]
MTGDDNHESDQPETSNPLQPIPLQTSQLPHTVSSIKFTILKNREYDIWALKIEHYLSHTDYPIWQVIQNGNGPVSVTKDTNGMIQVLPLKTAEEVVAREGERKARTTLLMALPEDHLAKFHKMVDAKEMWKAIKSRLGGNDESKRMQKYLLKQKFEGFSVSASEGLHKGSLPSSWSQVALIIRTKPGLDTLSFDDLYNNLRVFERDVKGTTASSSSNTHNVAFIAPQLDCDDLEQINDDDLEEMDLKWQNQDSRRRDGGYNGNKARDNSRRPAHQDDSKALVTMDGEDIDWSGHVEEDTQNFAMMAYSSSNSASDNEVQSCSKTCAETYARLKKLYDEHREKLGDASVEFTAYTLALKKVEAQLLCYHQNQLAYEQKIKFMKINLDDKTDVLKYHKKLLAEALKEKEDLKTKSVFMNKECDLENTPVNDRYAKGMHDVPSPMTGNYMPSGLDVEIDYSKFTYGPKQTSLYESNAKTCENASSESDSSVETTTSMPDPIDNTPKVIREPKVWTDAPIIKEYESDSDDDLVSNVLEEKEKPSFAFTDTVEHVKFPQENVKETGTPNHYPKIEKQDIHSHTRKGLGYARKSCFVCGSFSHLIRDCDFHKKRMAKQAALTKGKEKGTSQQDDPHRASKDNGIVDSGCSRHIIGNKAHLANYQEFKVALLPLEVAMEELLNKVLFTDTYCLVLSPDFKLPDENQVLLKIPKQHNMYSFNLKKIDPSGDLSCLLSKASIDESNKWHRRIGHVNFKNLNKLVKGNLVRGLPSKIFENDHTCVACQKGKQHKACCPQEANNSTGTQANDDQGANLKEIDIHDEHFVLLIWSAYSTSIKSSGDKIGTNEKPVSHVEQIFQEELEKLKIQEKEANDAVRKEAIHDTQYANTNSTNLYNVVNAPVSDVGPSRALNDDEPSYLNDPLIPHLEDIFASPSEGIFTNSSYDDEGVITDFNNLESTVNVSPTPTTRIHTIHPKTQILGDLMSAVQTRSKVKKNLEAHALKAIGTKWVYRNKKDERGVVVRNKARLVAQGHRQEEGIDYDEVFAPGIIDEEVYVTQLPGFVDPKFPNKVYKVVKALYGLHQALRACVKTATTPIETQKPLVKHEEAADVDVHLYRSMIGSLMYLIASRPDIMFAVCACSRFQVTPKTSHLQAVKRIFRYLKGQPKLGLWYPKVSSFNLEAYSDSDYAGANLDRKSTIIGCQFLGRRLISWQYKKQTIIAISTIEAEYVAVAHCYGQVLWIQNQLLEYGFNLMNTRIYIDNESTICIVKNHVFHLKTKHLEIRHHIIRDAYEKKLIQVLKIHTDDNVADLLTKAFDVSSKELASPKQTALGKDDQIR